MRIKKKHNATLIYKTRHRIQGPVHTDSHTHCKSALLRNPIMSASKGYNKNIYVVAFCDIRHIAFCDIRQTPLTVTSTWASRVRKLVEVTGVQKKKAYLRLKNIVLRQLFERAAGGGHKRTRVTHGNCNDLVTHGKCHGDVAVTHRLGHPREMSRLGHLRTPEIKKLSEIIAVSVPVDQRVVNNGV